MVYIKLLSHQYSHHLLAPEYWESREVGYFHHQTGKSHSHTADAAFYTTPSSIFQMDLPERKIIIKLHYTILQFLSRQEPVVIKPENI